MHVLHVARPLRGGVPRVVERLVADQVARGWRVTVACPLESDLHPATVAAGGEHLPWAATRSPGPSTADETRRLAGLLRRTRPEVVHLHSSKAGLCGRAVLRGSVPTLFQPHGWSFDMASGPQARLAAAWERASARWAHAVVCVSDGERERGERARIDAPWVVVPNGVDTERFAYAGAQERLAARRALGIPGDAPLAVLIGRFSREKAQDLMLEAWPAIRREVPGALLALVGEADTVPVDASTAEGVLLPGWIDDPRPWLAAATVVAVPSRSEAGLSLVAMEAMATGRSVVVSDVSGMRGGLGEGAGTVVAVGDVGAIARECARRLADPRFADDEGRVGRQRILSAFALDRSMDAMAELTEVIRGGRTTG